MPDATFVGIDNAAVPIARANAVVERLGLDNVSFHQVGIEAYEPPAEGFDYVIAHGVFSWVPDHVRDALLALCGRVLAGDGVAYVSYNALPGGHLRTMLRDALATHLSPGSPAERVAETPQVPRVAHRGRRVRRGARPHARPRGARGDRQRRRVPLPRRPRRGQPAVRPGAISSRAREPHGLRFLAEAQFSEMQPDVLPPDLRATAERIDDRVRREEYLDLLKERRFRQTLLCRADRGLTPEPAPERLRGMAVSGALRRTVDETTRKVTFLGPGAAHVVTDHPLLVRVLGTVGEAWPSPIPVEELGDERELPAIRDMLLRSYAAALVRLHVHPPFVSTEPPERPRISAYARLEAAEGATVTTVRHTHHELDDATREVAVLLDGTRDRGSLARARARAPRRGRAAAPLIAKQSVESRHGGDPARRSMGAPGARHPRDRGRLPQVYLIGGYIFGAGDALEAHRTVGFIVHALEVLILVAALVAWLPRTDLLLSLVMAVGGTVQLSLPGADDAWVGALHPLGALLVLVLGWVLLTRAGQVATARAPPRRSLPSRAALQAARGPRGLDGRSRGRRGRLACAVAGAAQRPRPRARARAPALARRAGRPARRAGVRPARRGAARRRAARRAARRRPSTTAVPTSSLLLGDFIDPDVRFGRPSRRRRSRPPSAGCALGSASSPSWATTTGTTAASASRQRWRRPASPSWRTTRATSARCGSRAWPTCGCARADVGRALADVPDGAPVILLSHDPDAFPRVPDRVALTVSGHTHGGQVAVPRLRRRFIPSRFGERYARGHVVEGGRHLYVTAGVGTTGWPVRLLRAAGGRDPAADCRRGDEFRAPARSSFSTAHDREEQRWRTFITIGYGDRDGYERTDPAVRDAAHAHDERVRATACSWASPASRSRCATTTARACETDAGPVPAIGPADRGLLRDRGRVDRSRRSSSPPGRRARSPRASSRCGRSRPRRAPRRGAGPARRTRAPARPSAPRPWRRSPPAPPSPPPAAPSRAAASRGR